MFDKASYLKSAILVAFGGAIISAAPPPEAPGTGVLCLGTFIYFVEKSGKQCRPGKDPEFQARIAGYARRFDDYIIRNAGGDPESLVTFKQRQNLNSEDHRYICEGAVADIYDRMKGMKADELERGVGELLARDGPPSFGDCV